MTEHLGRQGLRIGVPQIFDDRYRSLFPREAELVRVPDAPTEPIDIEFWVVPYMSKTTEAALPFLRGVKVMQALSAGVDAMLGAVPQGTTLCDGQGIHDIPVAEWTLAAVLAALKFFPRYDEIRQSEEWHRREEADDCFRELHPENKKNDQPVLGDELCGKHVLILGYGAIGLAIERRLAPFDVNITRVSRRAREGVAAIAELDSLLPAADIVIAIVPLTAETRGMFNAKRIAKMKQGALLVNAARGPVVDTEALVNALVLNRICAALDVTDPEPLPPGHPLWSAPNLLLTPHVAGGSPRFLERAFTLAGQQAARYLKGEPLLNVVTEGY